MKFAVAHAPVGASVILSWQKNDEIPKVEVLTSQEDKEKFVKNLTKDDTIFMILGGAEDRLALACFVRGASIFRIPSARLCDIAENDDVFPETDEFVDIDSSNEDEHIEESAEISSRKERAQRIYNAAIHNFNLFYLTLQADVEILKLVVLWKGFYLMQRTRIATHLRLLSVYRDLYLVDTAIQATKSEEEFILDKMSKEKTFAQVPPEARLAYLESIKSGDVVLETVTEREKELLKMIEKQLNRLPLFHRVFEPITGCGVITAARVIGTMSDIRRFDSDADLKAYAGYHHFSDGSRARRVKGKVSNWANILKQGVWNFSQRIVKMPANSCVWRNDLDCRRAYELVKLLRDINPLYLPNEIASSGDITSVRQLEIEHLDVLLTGIDGLRGEIEVNIIIDGKKKTLTYHEHLRIKYAELPALHERVKNAYDECLKRADKNSKKLLKGIKAKALQKACRWLGQRFLRHVFNEWKEFSKTT